VSLRTEQRLAAGGGTLPDPELHQAHKPSPDPELTLLGRINSVLIFLPHLVAAVGLPFVDQLVIVRELAPAGDDVAAAIAKVWFTTAPCRTANGETKRPLDR